MTTASDAARTSRSAPTVVSCRQGVSEQDVVTHRSIRHLVFVVEQGMFGGSDLDPRDEDGSAIVILGYCGDEVAGTVRLYELDAATGLWQGDRLAVLPKYRTGGVGGPLVRCAVALAGAHGGRAMVAHIQLPNVHFFTRLGWAEDGETETYADRPHQRMRIPLPDAATGAATVASLARGFPAGG